jgi:hypothetical protein
VVVEQHRELLLRGLVNASVEFIVVGMTAGVLLGTPVTTFDLDIVHRKTPENVDRLLAWLLTIHAYHRLDFASHQRTLVGFWTSQSGHGFGSS